MADIDPRLIEEQTNILKGILHSLSGGKTWGGGAPATGGGTSTAARGAASRAAASSTNMLSTAMVKASTSVKTMHGSMDDFVYGLRGMTSKLIGGEAIFLLIKGATDLGKTYSRLTDIGQTFHGSMFEMASQAGASGLSLEEFSKMLERNSTTAALMNDQTGGTVSGLGSLQKAVRSSLKDVGFFGMSLTQLTDLTSDYMETQRLTGQLGRMTEVQEQVAISNLTKNVTAFGEATGKSRQEMLKSINAATRETSAAIRMAVDPKLNDLSKQAFSTITAFLSAMPGDAGDKLSQFFAQTFGAAGENPFFSEMGRMFTEAGLPGLNARMSKMVQSVNDGITPSVESMVNDVVGMRDEILANQESLRARASAGDQAAKDALKFAQSLLGLDKDQLVAKIKYNQKLEEQNRLLQKNTANLMTLESDFHLLTGAFRSSFYMGISKMIGDLTVDPDGQSMKRMTEALNQFGGALGELLGSVFSQKNVDTMAEAIESFTKTLRDPSFIAGMSSLKDAVVGTASAIGWVLKKIHGIFESFGMSSGGATLLEAALILFAGRIWKMIKGIFGAIKTTLGFGVHVAQMVVRAGVVTGAAGAAGMTPPGAVGPGGTPRPGGPAPAFIPPGTAAPPGRIRGAITRMFGSGSMFRTIGGGILGMITGVAAEVAFSKLGDMLPEFPFKDKIIEFGGPAIGIITAMLAPALLGAVASAAAGWIGPALMALLAPEVLIPAVVVALGVAGFHFAKKKAESEANIGDTLGFVPSSMPGAVVDTPSGPMVSLWYDPKTGKTYSDDEAKKLLEERVKKQNEHPTMPVTPGVPAVAPTTPGTPAIAPVQPATPATPPLSLQDTQAKILAMQEKKDVLERQRTAGEFLDEGTGDLSDQIKTLNDQIAEQTKILKAQTGLQKKQLDATRELPTSADAVMGMF